MKLIDRHNGKGRILDEKGKLIGQGTYDLSVWQEVHHVKTFGGSSSVDGLSEIKGSIGGASKANVGTNLVLEFEDGRTFPFFFSDSSGTIAARGPISAKK